MAGAKRKALEGLPAAASIVEVAQFRPGGAARPVAAGPTAAVGAMPSTYRIIRTNEVDAYETPVPLAAVAAIGAPTAPPGDKFQGTARKTAKLSIAAGAPDAFDDLKKLVAALPAESTMVKHKPPITTDSSSARVAEEKHNVRVRAFLYAASREADNDFHLIIG